MLARGARATILYGAFKHWPVRATHRWYLTRTFYYFSMLLLFGCLSVPRSYLSGRSRAGYFKALVGSLVYTASRLFISAIRTIGRRRVVSKTTIQFISRPDRFLLTHDRVKISENFVHVQAIIARSFFLSFAGGSPKESRIIRNF